MEKLLRRYIDESTNELTKAFLEDMEQTGKKPALSPKELLEKMSQTTEQYLQASHIMKVLKNKYNAHRKKAHTVILAKRFDLLTNAKLVQHLTAIFADPKYKPTVTDMEQFVYIETQEISEPYDVAKLVCAQTKEEYEKWQGLLMWYMSENKLEGIEMMTLSRIDGLENKQQKG